MRDLDRVYIQKRDGEFINSTAFNMWEGCRLLGLHTVPFVSEELDSLDIRPETLVHGGIPSVQKAFQRLGIEEPHVPTAPPELQPFFGREMWTTTLGEIRRGSRGMFIKPLRQHKLFVGHVMRGELRDLIFTANYEDDVEVLASEVVEFTSEYRCFINKGLMIGCKHYRGDYTILPDLKVAQEAINAFASAPVSYSLDLGITDDDRTLVVEVNDAYALGCYGLPSIPYAQLVIDRWEQIVGLNTR